MWRALLLAGIAAAIRQTFLSSSRKGSSSGDGDEEEGGPPYTDGWQLTHDKPDGNWKWAPIPSDLKLKFNSKFKKWRWEHDPDADPPKPPAPAPGLPVVTNNVKEGCKKLPEIANGDLPKGERPHILNCHTWSYYGGGILNPDPTACYCHSWGSFCPLTSKRPTLAWQDVLDPRLHKLGFTSVSQQSLPLPAMKQHPSYVSLCVYWQVKPTPPTLAPVDLPSKSFSDFFLNSWPYDACTKTLFDKEGFKETRKALAKKLKLKQIDIATMTCYFPGNLMVGLYGPSKKVEKALEKVGKDDFKMKFGDVEVTGGGLNTTLGKIAMNWTGVPPPPPPPAEGEDGAAEGEEGAAEGEEGAAEGGEAPAEGETAEAAATPAEGEAAPAEAAATPAEGEAAPAEAEAAPAEGEAATPAEGEAAPAEAEAPPAEGEAAA